MLTHARLNPPRTVQQAAVNLRQSRLWITALPALLPCVRHGEEQRMPCLLLSHGSSLSRRSKLCLRIEATPPPPFSHPSLRRHLGAGAHIRAMVVI